MSNSHSPPSPPPGAPSAAPAAPALDAVVLPSTALSGNSGASTSSSTLDYSPSVIATSLELPALDANGTGGARRGSVATQEMSPYAALTPTATSPPTPDEKVQLEPEVAATVADYVLGSGTTLGDDGKIEIGSPETQITQSIPTKSSLIPTATPFVFTSRPTHARTNPPTPSAELPSHISLATSKGVGQLAGEFPTPALPFIAQQDPRLASGWSFDSRGLLVGGDHRTAIPDENIHLPISKPYSFFEPKVTLPTSQTLPNLASGGRLEDIEKAQQRRNSSAYSTDGEFWSPPRAPVVDTSANRYPSLEALRSRSSSFGGSSNSTSSYGGTYVASYLNQHPVAHPVASRGHQHTSSSGSSSLSFDRATAVQQLQNYFGPSSVDVSPACLNFHDIPYPTLPEGSLDSNPLAHLPSGYTYETDPEDLLYTQARQNFVQQSLSTLMSSSGAVPMSLNDPQIVLSRAAMMAHFDQAMHSSNPLATLYGLSTDAARALALNPEMSGISDSVLRLAASRGSKFFDSGAEFTGVQGPSANNRKLGLYKTELCRNWEEKGSCRYGSRCQYAHGGQEIRDVSRHPKFKTEVCRTFWQSGSCGYGKRCCFIHTTIPSGSLATASPPDSLAGAMNGFSLSDLPDTPPVDPNSPRQSRLSLSSSPTTSRGFGPALANYLEESSQNRSHPNSNVVGNSSRNGTPGDSPTKDKFSQELSSGGLFGIPFGGPVASSPENTNPGYGLGIKYGQLGNGTIPVGGGGGRFTNNPSEVPPQFQEPPQSRLQRLSSRGSLSLDPFSPHSFSTTTLPPSPATNAGNGNGGFGNQSQSAAMGRHISSGSFSTLSPSSSSGSIANQGYSPFAVPRVDSSSSIASSAFAFSSPNSTVPSHSNPSSGPKMATPARFPLQLASNDWLGNRLGGSVTVPSTSLDWSEAQDYLLDSGEANHSTSRERSQSHSQHSHSSSSSSPHSSSPRDDTPATQSRYVTQGGRSYGLDQHQQQQHQQNAFGLFIDRSSNERTPLASDRTTQQSSHVHSTPHHQFY